MNKLLIMGVAALMLTIAPAEASHCTDGEATNVADLIHIQGSDPIADMWIYAESGVKPGLQPGGPRVVLGDVQPGYDDCAEGDKDILIY